MAATAAAAAIAMRLVVGAGVEEPVGSGAAGGVPGAASTAEPEAAIVRATTAATTTATTQQPPRPSDMADGVPGDEGPKASRTSAASAARSEAGAAKTAVAAAEPDRPGEARMAGAAPPRSGKSAAASMSAPTAMPGVRGAPGPAPTASTAASGASARTTEAPGSATAGRYTESDEEVARALTMLEGVQWCRSNPGLVAKAAKALGTPRDQCQAYTAFVLTASRLLDLAPYDYDSVAWTSLVGVMVHAGFVAFGCTADAELARDSVAVAARRALPYLHELAEGPTVVRSARARRDDDADRGAAAAAASAPDAEALGVDALEQQLVSPPGLVTVHVNHYCEICNIRYRVVSNMVFGSPGTPSAPIVKSGYCPVCAKILSDSESKP